MCPRAFPGPDTSWHGKGHMLTTLTPLSHLNPWDRVVGSCHGKWSLVRSTFQSQIHGEIPTGHWDKPAAISPVRTRDNTSVMSTVSLSAPHLGDSFPPRFWEEAVANPYDGLSLSPQRFAKVLVSMPSACMFTFILVKTHASSTPLASSCRTWIYDVKAPCHPLGQPPK